jgi:hypothetical protein
MYIRFNSLSNRAYLIDLQEHRVASILLVSFFYPCHIGDQQVVTHELDLARLVEFAPATPIILGEWIFQQDDRVLTEEALVKLGQLGRGHQVSRILFQSKVVCLPIEELAGGRINGVLDLVGVAALGDCCLQEFERLLGHGNGWGEAAVIPDSGCFSSMP